MRPKWLLPVLIVAALVVVMVLSNLQPDKPKGLTVITTTEQLTEAINKAGELAQPVVRKAEAGQELTAEEKEQLLESAQLTDNASRFAPTAINLYIGSAQAYFYAGQIEVAEARVKSALANSDYDKDPMRAQLHAEGVYLLSLIGFKQGDYKTAAELAKEASKLNSGIPNYMIAEVSALIQLEKLEEADQLLHDVLAIDPENARADQLHQLIKHENG